ncbi:hypothetical protein BH10BAC3_BH10BAC3_19060 [soil metagenome]
MRKILLLIFYCLTQISFAFSQATKERDNICISIGIANPIGGFSSTELPDSKSGFAKIGESVSLCYSKPVTREWSFVAHLHAQRNPLNTSAFEKDLSQAKIYQGFYFFSDPNNPPPQTSYKIYPDWKFEKKSWLCSALLLGGQRQFNAGKPDGIHLFGRVMIGAVYANSPKISGSSFTDVATAHIEQSKSSAFGFAYSIGGGVNYNFTKTMFLTSSLTYFGTNQLTFKDVKATLTTTEGSFGSPEYSVQQSAMTGNAKQIISAVNISVGIGIKL